MSHLAKYKILPEYNLIIEYWRGTLGYNNFIDFKSRLISDKDYNPNYSYLDDFRNTIFNVDKYEIKKYIEKFAIIHENNIPKIAQLTDTPNQVVNMKFFQAFKEGRLECESAPFSTIESALHWLDQPYENHPGIKKNLSELRSTD